MGIKPFLSPGQWEGAKEVPYVEGVRKLILMEGVHTQVRYFELEPGRASRRESHEHEHLVTILWGRGEVFLKDQWHPLKPYDCVHVPGFMVHQFRNAGEEPFGFLCIIKKKGA